ncbi:S8 family serine peptidase [Massilia eburnea]|uniref:S8 family serine peptidase n=1 Tax=Massilia eburnea TaxID=1776165 RepID=UPI003D6AF1AE
MPAGTGTRHPDPPCPAARWGMVSGSSYAAAHVSGMLALIGEIKPQLSAQRPA